MKIQETKLSSKKIDQSGLTKYLQQIILWEWLWKKNEEKNNAYVTPCPKGIQARQNLINTRVKGGVRTTTKNHYHKKT